jgi:radical SAM enzyme (TIGR01210 family)
MPVITHLLSDAARAERSTRRSFVPPAKHFTQVTESYAEIWFPSLGCPWDALGHCTTCNYGAPKAVHPDAMVGAVEFAVASLAPSTEVIWVSAFDTLHDEDVPVEARERIFSLLASTPANTIITEAHPASVRPDRLSRVIALPDGKTLGVELGVETMDEFVRYACLNKPFTNARLARAVAAIQGAGAEAWANLLVGIPFLSRTEVVEDSVYSAVSAVELGLDQLVLFPNHVKKFTVAEALAVAGRYDPPDLWVVRDVLAQLPRSILERTHLAWMEVKNHPGAPEVRFGASSADTTNLLRLLSGFNMERDTTALDEALQLPNSAPPSLTSEHALVDRMLEHFEWLAVRFEGRDWWTLHGVELKAELEAGFETSHLSLARP